MVEQLTGVDLSVFDLAHGRVRASSRHTGLTTWDTSTTAVIRGQVEEAMGLWWRRIRRKRPPWSRPSGATGTASVNGSVNALSRAPAGTNFDRHRKRTPCAYPHHHLPASSSVPLHRQRPRPRANDPAWLRHLLEEYFAESALNLPGLMPLRWAWASWPAWPRWCWASRCSSAGA